jgi:predicted glycosyltransferase
MIRKLEKNHKLLCTSRNYREATELNKIRKLNLTIVGKHGGTEKSEKLKVSIDRMHNLFQKVKKFSPDTTISFCSPEASRISFGMGIKHIAFCNAPHSEAVMRLSLPLIQNLLIPRHIPKKEFSRYGISQKNIIQYNALDEYLIVKEKIVHNTLPKLLLEKNKTIIFRTYEAQASYVSKNIPTIKLIQKISKEFPDCNFIVLGRYSNEIKSLKQQLGKKIIILDKVVDSGDLLSLCDVFIGSGGTMTSEAALRGIPTISYDAVPNLDEKFLVRKKLVKRATSSDKIVKLTKILLKSDRNKIKQKAKSFLDSMEDPYSKLSDLLKK